MELQKLREICIRKSHTSNYELISIAKFLKYLILAFIAIIHSYLVSTHFYIYILFYNDLASEAWMVMI